MTVYVDEFRQYGPVGASVKDAARTMRLFRDGSSHLTADTVEELHALADRIGMRREWFQDHPVHPHYDLTKARRAAALLAGAEFVPAKIQARRRYEKRIGIAHVQPGCDLAPGNSWRECSCAAIDPADRPCVTCEAIAESAKRCPGCAYEQRRRP